jgi:phosphate acetyltransferase
LAKSVYIASMQPRAGKSLVALGLMELVSRRVERLGYFRPIVNGTAATDREILLMRSRYDLPQSIEASCGGGYDEARALTVAERYDELLERILFRYKELESKCDFVVCEGTDFSGVGAAFEFGFNARVAAHLGSPVFFVANGQDRTAEGLLEDVRAARGAFQRAGCSVVASLINRVEPDQIANVKRSIETHWQSSDPIYAVPSEESLGQPTMAELMRALDGTLVFGDEKDMQRPTKEVFVAAMELPNVLAHLKPDSVIITGGDRADVLLASLVSVRSAAFPNVAGVVLTGGIELPQTVRQLISGLRRSAIPVINVPDDTFHTATRVHTIGGAIYAGDDRKIATALGLFEEHVDRTQLVERIQLSDSTLITPLRFEYELIERAKASRQRIVLPEATDERILRAADILLRRKVVDLTLLGDVDEIEELASTLGVRLDGADIIDPLSSDRREVYADTYLQLRKHKGVTADRAYDIMGDVSYFGTMMVRQGDADGMVSGAAHTTAHTIRPALEAIRTADGVSVVSSVFLMCLRDRVLVYGDCAVNPDPTAPQLADIAISSAETAASLGIEPRIAMLSYSTGGSSEGGAVSKVREATEILRKRRPDLKVEGPIQYDAAVDASVARKKLPNSEVAGNATVLIFPDLDAGNNAYKAVQRSADALAIGPVLQGLRKPVNDLSRGCTVHDIVNTVAVTAIQAQTTASEP